MATTFDTPHALLDAIGKQLGESDPLEITQERINLFAEATGDHQWIHVDPERAAKGPFGKPIAHGYLTLSLASYFLPRIITVNGISMGVNYGTEKVRFPAPVPVGSKVRASAELVNAEEIKGCIQATVRVTMTVEGNDRPSCVVDTISRYYPA